MLNSLLFLFVLKQLLPVNQKVALLDKLSSPVMQHYS